LRITVCGEPRWQRSFRRAREPHAAIGKRQTVNSRSDAEVIGRSLDQPEAFGLIYDRHAATVLRFLGRRAGAEVAEGLVGELFRIAFERRKTFDTSRSTAPARICVKCSSRAGKVG